MWDETWVVSVCCLDSRPAYIDRVVFGLLLERRHRIVRDSIGMSAACAGMGIRESSRTVVSDKVGRNSEFLEWEARSDTF